MPNTEARPKHHVGAGAWPTLRQDPSTKWTQGVCPAPNEQPKHHASPRSFSSIVIIIFKNLLMIIIIIIIIIIIVIVIFSFTFQIKVIFVFQY
jgi:hypothetical protein